MRRITVDDLPADARAVLVWRSEQAGVSLADYVRELLVDHAVDATLDEVFLRAGHEIADVAVLPRQRVRINRPLSA